MKKFSIRMTALLIALLMALTFVFVGCDEDEEKGNDDNGKNGITVTKNNAEAMLKAACEKFKTTKSLELAVVSDYNGEKQTDRTTALINADGEMVVYAENQVGEETFEYTYSLGTTRYEKNPYMGGVYEYENDERLTFESLIDDIYDSIFDSDADESIAIFCKSNFRVKKIDGGYSISLEKVGAEEFFKAMLDKDDYKEEIEPNLGTLGAFEGSIIFELYSDGNFKTIAFAYSATMNGESRSMGMSYEFNKYNDDSIKIEEPAWVTEYKANKDDDDNSEEVGGDVTPENPGGNGNEGNQTGGNEGDTINPDDTTESPVNPDQGGDETVGKTQYDDLLAAINAVKNADTLKFRVQQSDGNETKAITISAVKGSDGSYKILGEGDSGDFYVDSNGVAYYFQNGQIHIEEGVNGLDYILGNYLSNYGFADIESVLQRMSEKDFEREIEDGNVEYSLDSDYVEFSYIVDPSLAENQGFQSMISGIKESDVDVTFVLDSDGALRYLSADVEVDLGDMQTMIDEDIEIITINGIVEFDEPDWVANAK